MLLLERVLSGTGVHPHEDVRAFFSAHERSTRDLERPVDRAIAAGASADRLGYAFAGGYAAALDALLGERVPPTALAATEQGGAHPRAITTRLERTSEGWRLRGEKNFVTLASLVDAMLVVASVDGAENAAHPTLRVARVPVSRDGVRVVALDPLPFVPEVPHAIAFFEDVRVEPDEVLEGDGYTRYVKPFRTIEDIHVHAALLGYLCAVGARATWPDDLRERTLSALVAARALAAEDPSAATTHLALAGLLRDARAIVASSEAHWGAVEPAERERWARDRPLLSIAEKARTARRERAWERVRGARH
jgi:hypothetical protein